MPLALGNLICINAAVIVRIAGYLLSKHLGHLVVVEPVMRRGGFLGGLGSRAKLKPDPHLGHIESSGSSVFVVDLTRDIVAPLNNAGKTSRNVYRRHRNY